ncbi:cysteine desulfurase [Staphylococcus sp. SQ8-PEA]|uniref:Cysteine desulfurase n=1 Tax=Staphylococcus marylandisciuri TaxID=2981529 RepID=A0ABT2QQ59_9STAP|nr:cysteine desulfurase family protein [Staphylococcus marylandisciuri]MCU5746116.1 cysteine desulfurase [Staphylococcus marylandisciuri]
MIYLDNAATTEPNNDVLESFVKASQSLYYNPNSPHKAGNQAEQLLMRTKSQINNILGLNDEFNILFTSGATESNNIALKGIAYHKRDAAPEIITSVLEHPSVLEVVRALGEEGFKVKYCRVTSEGKLDLSHLQSLMTDSVGLVTCMYVNNIMGQIQPVSEVGAIVKQYPKAHLHVDAVQAIGKIPLNYTNIDSMSLSGHKFNGLKGQGILFIRNLHHLQTTIHGGGQEYGLRSGTVNLPLDIAIVKALRSNVMKLDENYTKIKRFNEDLREFLSNYKGVYINSPHNAAPHILNIALPGVKGEVVVNAFSKYDVMLSTTSACSSKEAKLNEVLLGMKINDARIEGSIRISFGNTTTCNDIQEFKSVFKNVYDEVKEMLL